MLEVFSMPKNTQGQLLEKPHVVEEFMLGGTRIRIADDYCRDVTVAEVDVILKRIAERVSTAYFAGLDREMTRAA